MVGLAFGLKEVLACPGGELSAWIEDLKMGTRKKTFHCLPVHSVWAAELKDSGDVSSIALAGITKGSGTKFG